MTSTACMQHVAPRCEWLPVMAVGRAGEKYNFCLYYHVGFSDKDLGLG